MKPSFRIAFLLSAFLWAICQGQSRQDQVKPVFWLLPDFRQLSPDEGSDMVNSVDLALGHIESDLLMQLSDEHTAQDTKTYLIFLLGQMRSRVAVKPLYDLIDFKATRMDPAFAPRRWGEFPAQEALVKIGTPAAIEGVNRLGVIDVEANRKSIAKVILAVDGKELGRSRIDFAIAQEKQPDARSKLGKALQYFQ
jgi:hypothetical protein